MSGFALFLVVLATALTALVIYVARRAAEVLGVQTRARRWALTGLLLVVILAPFVVRLAGIDAGSVVARSALVVSFVVALGAVIASGFLLPLDGIGWLWTRWRRRSRASAEPATPSPAPSPRPAASEAELVEPEAASSEAPVQGRRSFVARAAYGSALALGGSTSTYGVLLGRHDYQLEEVPIPLRDLAPSLDGFTIAQLSDLHVGSWVGDRELAAGIDLVRRARPDLIVLTGDLLDHDARYAPDLGAFARRLVELDARHGVVAIPGNHDYYAGIDEVLGALRAAGVTVLRNDARSIGDAGGRFALLGVDDVWAARSGEGQGADLDAALLHAPRDVPRVLLCHNPELYPEVAERVDLQISGHTHGGQVNFVVRPADVVLRHGYVAGHYHRGASQIYVNRGFGTAGPPARVGSPPEVTRIVLTRA